MVEARFLIDSAGEATRNPHVLDVAGGARLGMEADRIVTTKLATQALHRAGIRIAKGLLLEPSSDSEAADDERLAELPTEEFEIVAAEVVDPERVERIRTEREKRKSPSTRQEEVEAHQRRQRRAIEARERLDGRRNISGKRRSGRK